MENYLPQDIIRFIFGLCSITDKRNFIRTCKNFNKLFELMPIIEKEFQYMIRTNFIANPMFIDFEESINKYSMELIYDGYVNLFPERYIFFDNYVIYRYHEIYYNLALRGNFDMILLLFQSTINYSIDNEERNAYYIMKGAAKSGHKHILEWMLEKDYKIDGIIIAEAIKGDNMDIYYWLINNKSYWNNIEISYFHIEEAAIITNKLDIVKSLIEKNMFNTIRNYGYELGRYGNFNLIEQLLNDKKYNIDRICDGAAMHGHLEILKLGYQHGFKITSNEFAFGGHIHILEWLLKNDNSFKKEGTISEHIARGGNFKCLKWAINNGFLVGKNTYAYVAMYGDIEMLQWLYDRGTILTKYICSLAASYGHLNILKWMLNNGYKFNDKICYKAAANGHLKIVQWCKENRYFWEEKVCAIAARHGHFKILKWAYENGCEWGTRTCSNAALFGNLDILKWLRNNQCSWDEKTCFASVGLFRWEILKWAIENGCEFGNKTYDAIKNTNNEEMISWISSRINAKC
jgi:hypothetical protein